MSKNLAISLILFIAALPARADSDLDVKGGIIGAHRKVVVPPRESRFEEVRESREGREDRSPRANKARQLLDHVLDASIKGHTGNDIKHGLDAAQNIHELFKIREERLQHPEDEKYFEEKYE